MTELFRYCPACGAYALKPNSAKSMGCSACGFEFFFNAAGAVAALIVNDQNDLLITIRAGDPGKGLWDLPGGFVDPGESAEQALRREIKEELNLEVASLDYFTSAANTYHYKQITYPTIDLAYLCRVHDFETMKPQDDVAATLFATAHDIKNARFAFESIRSFAQTFMTQSGCR